MKNFEEAIKAEADKFSSESYCVADVQDHWRVCHFGFLAGAKRARELLAVAESGHGQDWPRVNVIFDALTQAPSFEWVGEFPPGEQEYCPVTELQSATARFEGVVASLNRSIERNGARAAGYHEQLIAERARSAKLVSALRELRGIWMRRHGTEAECLAHDPNHEFTIIADALKEAGGSDE